MTVLCLKWKMENFPIRCERKQTSFQTCFHVLDLNSPIWLVGFVFVLICLLFLIFQSLNTLVGITKQQFHLLSKGGKIFGFF